MLRTKAQEVAVVDLQSLMIMETGRKQCLKIRTSTRMSHPLIASLSFQRV
jgi:hypothetical protein